MKIKDFQKVYKSKGFGKSFGGVGISGSA